MALHILDVIKYEGNNTTFAWKHTCTDFNHKSTLIVHETQEAVFFANGKIVNIFGPGRYCLDSENYFFIKELKKTFVTGGDYAFHCEVYFVNKVEQMAIRWGTDSKVQYIDPTYHFPLSLGASGEMSLSVSDSEKLLTRLVGTERLLDRPGLVSYFKALLMTRVKTYIAQEMQKNAISIFEIDAQLETFSASLKTRLTEDFLEYGIALRSFFVTTIVKPEGEPQYEKFKELYFRQYADIAEAQLRQKTDIIYAQTEAQKVVIDSQAQATKRAQEGYSYQQERSYDVAEKAAQNEAVGEFTNMGIGIGMMSGIGGSVGGFVGGAVNNAFTSVAPTATPQEYAKKFCDQCGTELSPEAAFCDNCGAAQGALGTCSQCGFAFIKPGKFCPRCGMKRNIG